MKRSISVICLVCLVALTPALSFPVVEQTAGWGTSSAIAAETGSKDRNPGTSNISDSGTGGLNQRPTKPSKIPEPATIVSILAGVAGVALFVRWRKKGRG